MKTTARNLTRPAIAWLLTLTIISCTDSHRMENEIGSRLEEIKMTGDTSPEVALLAYDSLQGNSASLSRYTRNKYALLGIRLHDKAYILPTSDSCICELVSYFEKNGTNKDRQEAYYYAGSVYRDLQDTPRSLEYFLKSAHCTETGEYDSLMLRNCYSQLYSLYFNVQDYCNAKDMAEQECELAKKNGILDDISKMHLVNAHLRTGETIKGQRIAKEVLESQENIAPATRSQELLYSLLYALSFVHDTINAKICHGLIRESCQDGSMNNNGLLAHAEFYESIGQTDSCIYLYQKVFQEGDTLQKYDASRNLFYLYDSLSNKEQAYEYACKYIDISTELDLGKRQELAATTNNRYLYYKDKKKQDELREGRKRAQMRLGLCLSLGTTLAFAALALYTFRKFKRIKYLQSISSVQHSGESGKGMPNNEQELMKRIKEEAKDRKHENEELKTNLVTTEKERQQKEILLNMQTQKIEKISKALESLETEIEKKKEEAKRLTDVNVILSKKAHQARMTASHWDIMNRIGKALNGQYVLTEEDWYQFLAAIDQEYPLVSIKIAERLGNLKKGQERAFYLLIAGFSPAQAAFLIDSSSRSTILRWCKEYKEIVRKFLSQSIQSIP